MALFQAETVGAERAASLCTEGPRPTASSPAPCTSSTRHRTARLSTAGGSTASLSLCPVTRLWWWKYCHDNNTDMFQIGRSTESPIDFVVTDTVRMGGKRAKTPPSLPSTISRFACRVVCERNPPYTARIYAAGFDSSKNIFLGEKATKWKNPDGHMDGLTTNGVLVMHPEGFPEDPKQGLWREISVCGDVYSPAGDALWSRAGANWRRVRAVHYVTGSLVDLCGATLLWRTGEGLMRAPTLRHLEALRQELNASRPQCPCRPQHTGLPQPATQPQP
ncbi:E3 ubiquitin-protein ligase pellino-like protein 1 [Larimichthys crocea]|uniref:Uncharacterized protein n=1 Tax=Larimichthys crocea TaxID=215358 RepID=A0ACD3R1V1_LARCR|nr:E3 ubiquitin-protein ligase pellino-like protein 1 [Larimichthys crocea]